MPTVNGTQYPYTEQGIDQAMEAEMQQPQPQGQPDPAQAYETQESTESPELQAQFQTYLDRIEALMRDESVSGALIELGKSNPDSPLAGIGKMVSTLIIRMDEQVKGEIPEDMILPLAEHVTEMVGKMVGATLNRELSEEELEGVTQFAVGELVQEYGVDEDALVEVMQGMSRQEVEAATNQAARVAGGRAVFGRG